MACVADREAAVREVAQVYELIKLQQPLLLNCSSSSPPSTQLAQSLLSKALRALNVALSVMKQQQQQQPVVAVKAEPHLSPPSPASADSEAIAPSTATRGAKRRRSSVAMEGKKKTSSWETLTAVPYDDGYQWRKYGEKKINGTLFTRSYFRCTYKQDDGGCLATKHVQQIDNDSYPPMFQVTYNNHHTCSSAKATAPNNNTGSSSNLAALLAGCGSSKGLTTTNARPTGHATAAAMNMKQEEPPLLLLPPRVEPPACFPYDDQTMPQCQEPLFPTSMEQQFVCDALRDHDSPVDGGIPSASTGSCISGETSWWDGYSGDMAAQMAAEDDPLHDLDRFLQCDSFMDYQY
ncbi:unnamed protein product [Miscanthus lutarioriparius]|uniref:WRKY domain-containing protein n=1 Tax=Miscanthus lutarioriparius TaxID=422564 RepID=A0A811QH17_9POAL|nr:unnamed protein product [Miscanthus lutarioriparius]